MKRLITIAVFSYLFHFCQAQTNYYFADKERNYWQEDSTSVNIIVADLEQYDMIVDRILEMFSDKTDTVSFVKDDDNIIIISEKLRTIPIRQLIPTICNNSSDISFITYAKKVSGRRIWLRHEAYLRLKHDSLYSTYLQPYLSTFTNFTFRYDGLQKEYIITCDDERMLMEIANGLYDNQYVA